MPRDDYAPEFKAERVFELLTGQKRLVQAAQEYGVSKHALIKWKKRLVEKGYIIFEKGNRYRDVTKAEIEVESKPYLKRMKELRQNKGILQKDLGAAIGISRDSYSKYECGFMEMPIKRLMRLCSFYGVSMDYMMGLTDKKK